METYPILSFRGRPKRPTEESPKRLERSVPSGRAASPKLPATFPSILL